MNDSHHNTGAAKTADGARVPFRHSLAGRILLYAGLPSAAIMALVMTIVTTSLLGNQRAALEDSLQLLATQVAAEIERGNTRATMAVRIMAFAQQNGMFGDRAESSAYARRVLEAFPEFTGAYFGYEPNADTEDAVFRNSYESASIASALDESGRFLPYWYRDQADNTKVLLEPLVDMETSLYYQGVKDLYLESGQPQWLVTEPYVYEGKMIVEQVYPIVVGGRFVGIAGVDRALDDIGNTLKNIRMRDGVELFLISRTGRVIAASGETIDDLKTLAIADTPYAEILGGLYAESDIAQLTRAADPFTGESHYFASSPIPTGDWMLVVSRPESDLAAPLRATLTPIIAVSAFGILAILGIAFLIVRRAGRRIGEAVQAADLIAAGSSAGGVLCDQRGRDEVSSLNQSFNRLLGGYRDMVGVCRAIAEGDYTQKVALRSDQDELALAINEMADKREAAERALTESEERTRLLLESTTEGFFGVGTDGLITFINGAAAQTLGYERAELLGQSAHELIHYAHPNGAPYPAEDCPMFRSYTSGQRCRIADEVLWRKDGSAVDVEYSSVPIREGDEILGAVVVFRDISEQAELNRNLVALLENATEYIYVMDRERRFVAASQRVAVAAGKSSWQELIGKTWHDLMGDEFGDMAEEGALPVIRDGAVITGLIEEAPPGPEGEERFVRSNMAPVRDRQGQIVGMVGISADITEEKRLADELAAARDDAECANRAKSSFLANMSHELRTPMNAIIGYSEMLIEEIEEEDGEDYVDDLRKISAAGKHLLALINDILDLSKIESGRMDLYLERFELKTMLDEAATTVAPLMAKNNLRFDTDYPDDLGVVRVDLTKLRQALFNLLSNAAKFTHDGVVTLRVRRYSADGQERIKISVIDDGIGISEDKIAGLFDEFTQADVSTTRKYGGTGLGLSISRRFCRMMGGDISVASEVGKGSVFAIDIPATVDALEAGRIAVAEEQPETQPAVEVRDAVSTDGSLVLVIEDDADARRLLGRTLEKEGYRVAMAPDGDTGLGLARTLSPDVITLDVMMPGTDGWAVLRTLKADEALRHIPVVMVTIVTDKGMGYALGADDYLTKPVDRELLLQVLKKYAGTGAGRVLIVEDDADARDLLHRLLEHAGMAVIEACNGQEGLERVADSAPDLIMLDLMMPVMDGFEFLTRLRSAGKNTELPVIVLTAKTLTDRERQFLEGRASQVLAKTAHWADTVLAEIQELL